jgi:hypothetical protein
MDRVEDVAGERYFSHWISAAHSAEQFALIQMNIGREVCRRLRATDERLFKATTGEQQSGLETLFLDA